MTQHITVLGSTGSIGRSTLEVVRHHAARLAIHGLAAYGSRVDDLLEQVMEFRPRRVAVVDPDAASRLRSELPDETELLTGEQGVVELAADTDAARLVAAAVGIAGVRAVHAALEAGVDVALANKESLVAAGRLLRDVAAAGGAQIIPIDSEHAALHQALADRSGADVRQLVLTASGGPFRTRPRSEWDDITPQEALAHPTWDMGDKISIDSATMMNKGLEVIEAVHLFDLPIERIGVVVHPQSKVHALVEFCDGAWLAQLAPNDMIYPIQYALSLPQRWENRFPRLQPDELGRLEFEAVDDERFPAVALARAAFEAGESAPAVLSAANEVAVRAFLSGRLSFGGISELARRVLETHEPSALSDLEDALHWDAWARRQAEALLT
jgi:1-deoxy-D-xylulose-5-phosphate reductoisomerase